MANWNSKTSGFSIKFNSTGTPVDIGQYVNNLSFSGGNALVDDTGLGEAVRTEAYDIGNPNIMNITFFVNSTTDGIFGLWLDGTSVSQTIQFKVFTSKYYSGSSIVGPVSYSSPIGLQTGTCEFHSDSGTGFNRTSVAIS